MRTARLLLCCLPLWACVGTRSALRPEDRGPVLFTVTDPSKPGASLSLMGTVHLERADYRLDRAVEKALEAADQLSVEIDTTPELERELQTEALRLGTLPEGKTAKDVLKPETWAGVERECARLHVEPARLSKFRPWLIGLTLGVLSMQAANPGMRGELGLDKRVAAMTRARGKPITSLETSAFQLGLLSGGDAALQDARLAATLRGMAKGDTGKALFAAFEAGDLGTLEKMALESDDHSPEHEAFLKRFWVDRNVAMFEKLKASFGTPLRQVVAVGTGHLLGDQGLVRLFEKAGFVVERARSEGPGSPWVAPWHTEQDPRFSLTFPGVPTRRVTPLAGGADSLVLLWQGGTLAYAAEVTHAPGLALAMETKRAAIFQTAVDELAKGRSITMSETIEFAGHPALHVIIDGGTPLVHIETYAVDSGDVVYSLRAVSVGGSAAVPQEDFKRFFDSFSLK